MSIRMSAENNVLNCHFTSVELLYAHQKDILQKYKIPIALMVSIFPVLELQKWINFCIF